MNDEWTVWAVGDLDRADVRNTFDVTRHGEPYVTDAYLHWDSDPFNREYPVRFWIARNVLRIGAWELFEPIHHITVRNEASSAIKWMRVGGFQFFLVFDLPPGASLRLPCDRWEGGYGFSAQGELLDAGPFSGQAVTSDWVPRPVTVAVTDSGVRVTIERD